MVLTLAPQDAPLAVIDDPLATPSGSAPSIEHAVFHPSRGSVVSVTSGVLQELDVSTGALLCYIQFDLLAATDNANATSSSPSPDDFELLTAAGTHHVVAVFQMRYLVVWDLEDAVLESVSQLDKVNSTRRMTALAASLCTERWVFFGTEASSTVRALRLGSLDVTRKISRKGTLRGAPISCLAFSTTHNLLGCGCADGSLQIWRFAEATGEDMKTSAPLATLLVSAPSTSSMVVKLAFSVGGTFLAVASQNQRVDVWTLSNTVYTCVATTTLSPPHVHDFSKSSGELSLVVHPQVQVLVAHWHAAPDENDGRALNTIAVWEFHLTSGNMPGSPHSGASRRQSETAIGNGTISRWLEVSRVPLLYNDALLSEKGLCSMSTAAAETTGGLLAVQVQWWQNSVVVYASLSGRRALFLVKVQQPAQEAVVPSGGLPDLNIPVTLSTVLQLTLSQYHDYPMLLPSELLQIVPQAKSSSATSNRPGLVLQQFSLHTGAATSSSSPLPAWQSECGKVLSPFRVLSNRQRSAVCIMLREEAGQTLCSGVSPSSFSYAVLELEPSTQTIQSSEDLTEEGEVDGQANLPVLGLQIGAIQHATRDVYFCEAPFEANDAESTINAQPLTLLVLSDTGLTLSLQTTREGPFACLNLAEPIERVFLTPLPLVPSSPHQSTVGFRLVYLLQLQGTDQQERLVLSEHDLSLPVVKSSTSTCVWTSEPNERVVDVQWNTPTVSSGTTQVQERQFLMMAVVTTRRLVVLSPELRVLRAYDFVGDLQGHPQSIFWVAQTLLYVTESYHVRFVTPAAIHIPRNANKLLCSLPRKRGDSASSSSVQLLAICGDRLSYMIADPTTLQCHSVLRPVALCEPILLGFAQPNATLRRVFEREALAFVLTGTESDRPVCPITNIVLKVTYHAFGWKDIVLKLLKALLNPQEMVSTGVSSGGGTDTGGPSSAFSKTAHLCQTLMASLFLDAQRWEDFIRIFLAHDPALEQYAVTSDDSATAKLPSKMGLTAQRFRQLAEMFEALGQPKWALRCLDLSGDDEALVTLLWKLCAIASPPVEILDALHRAWSKLNPPLGAVVKAAGVLKSSSVQQQTLDSNTRGPQDPFTMICCEKLVQPVRRGRLLPSVAPFERLAMATEVVSSVGDSLEKQQQPQDDDPSDTDKRAHVLPWKRLAPEDERDWVGSSATAPRLAAGDTRPLNYTLFASESSPSIGILGDANSTVFTSPGSTMQQVTPAKQSIGPFQDEEDAVVAYWRFEEGASAPADRSNKQEGGSDDNEAGLECLDTSKRENHLRILGGEVVTLVESSAPVDRGEAGRVPEEFAMRLPPSSSPSASKIWGAQCDVLSGGTLDVGMRFDDDPYRRKLTFEAWVRNYRLAESAQQSTEGGEEANDQVPRVRQLLVARQNADTTGDTDDKANTWWELAIDSDDRLLLVFAGQELRATQTIEVSQWRHVAFSVDVASPERASLKLFLDAQCVGESHIRPRAPTTKSSSTSSRLVLGWRMYDLEITEVRLWATARSPQQIGDMRENYLGLAEAKKRMKIAIHQRDCACSKCVARRVQTSTTGTSSPLAAATKLFALNTALPMTPPNSRSRRRVPQAKET